MKSLLCTLSLVIMILGCGHSQDSLKNYSLSLSVLLDSLSLPEEGIHVKIDKSDYPTARKTRSLKGRDIRAQIFFE
jgi:ABC-type uncharacterized transport system auxiliary subunit